MELPDIQRAAIYLCRNSADRDTSERQSRELRHLCQNNAYTICSEYTDTEIGLKTTRDAFARMMCHAEKKRFDVVLFWSLHQFSHSGMRSSVAYLQKLEQAGVAFRSFTEPYINSSGIFKDAIISILDTLSHQENSRQSSNVRANLELAKAKAKRLPRISMPTTDTLEPVAAAKTHNHPEPGIGNANDLDDDGLQESDVILVPASGFHN